MKALISTNYLTGLGNAEHECAAVPIMTVDSLRIALRERQ